MDKVPVETSSNTKRVHEKLKTQLKMGVFFGTHCFWLITFMPVHTCLVGNVLDMSLKRGHSQYNETTSHLMEFFAQSYAQNA